MYIMLKYKFVLFLEEELLTWTTHQLMVLSILLHRYLVKYGPGGRTFLTHINILNYSILLCI